MKSYGFLSLVMSATLAGPAQGFDLSGSWHVSGLGVPAGLVQNRDGAGVVTGLSGNDTFDANDGTLSIDPAGNVSGFVGNPITGSATVSPDGLVSLALSSPEVMTLTFHISSTSDLMASSHGETDYSELLVLAKAPVDALPADAVGTWWVVALETPASLDLQFNAEGKMTGLGNGSSYYKSRNRLVIDAAGNYNYNSGEETGGVGVTSDGTMSLTPADPLKSAMQFHMNALKDVMITASAEVDHRSLTVLVKSDVVHNWEAAGHWSLDSLNLPAALSVTLNGDNLVTNIDGLDSFGQTNGTINFTLDGGLSGVMEGSFAGYANGSTNGLLNIFHGEPIPLIAAMNTGGDFFVGVEGGSPANDLSMLIGIRSVRPLEVGVLPGVPPTVVWVPGLGRVLQEAPNAVDWETVTGSETMSSYTPNLATEGSRHFYRVAGPP